MGELSRLLRGVCLNDLTLFTSLTVHRLPDKSVKSKIIIFISRLKHMLWVFKGTVSIRFF